MWIRDKTHIGLRNLYSYKNTIISQHLSLNLVIGVSEEDGGGWVTGAHLGLGSLQSWEEGGVKESRLWVAQTRCHISCHSKVGVLRGGELNWNGTGSHR